MKDIIVVIAGVLLLLALITGVGWCKWVGYKDRYPHGGCIGFVTDASCQGSSGKR